MQRFARRQASFALGAVVVAMITACAVAPEPEVPTEPAELSCRPTSESDALLGNWLAVRAQKGVLGELRTLISLQADGTMALEEQLKRKGRPSQGLSETGCWQRDGDALVLQTLESNGSPVAQDDPIYQNRYTVLSLDDNMLRLGTQDGGRLNAKRMPSGYRLPF